MNQVTIPQKTLRWISKVHIPVIHPDGQEESLEYLEIYGMILVPVSDAHELALSASTIRRYIREGKLTGYNENGTKKTNTRSTRVYFNLNEWRDLTFKTENDEY